MSNQGSRQASVRAISGTQFTYEGDWHAMWNLQAIPQGTFNERMLAYINTKLGTAYTELNGAMAALAKSFGIQTFNELATFDASTAPIPAFSIDLSGPTFPSNITATRPSSATYFDQFGLRQIAAADQPRMDYNPQTYKMRGYLHEGSRTNYLLNSLAPVTQTVTLPTGVFYLWMEGSGSVAATAGTAVGSGFGSATNTSGLGTFGSFVVLTITTSGTVDFTVTGIVTAFQCESGSNFLGCSSLIITTSSAATRAQDIVAPIPAVSSGINSLEGTVITECDILGYTTGGGGSFITTLQDNAGTYMIRQNLLNFAFSRGSTILSPLSGSGSSMYPATTASQVTKIATSYLSGDNAVFIDATDRTGTLNTRTFSGTFDSIILGRGTGGNPFFGHFRKVSIYNKRLDNTTTQNLTVLDPILLPVNSTMAQMGDSITANGWVGNAANGSYQYNVGIGGFWGNVLSGGRMRQVYRANFGISGDTAVNMNARYDAEMGPTNAAIHSIEGGTNDLGSNTAANIITALSGMVTKARGYGAKIILWPILPRTAGFALSPADETKRQTVNAWVDTQVASDLAVLNISGFNPTVGVHTVDGIHPNAKGAYLLGKAYTVALNKFVDSGDCLFKYASNPANLLANGFLTGTAGNRQGSFSSGVVANSMIGWYYQGSGTGVFSKVTNPNGGDFQQLAFNSPATVNSGGFSIDTGTITLTPNLPIGTMVEAFCEVEVDNPVNMTTLSLILTTPNTTLESGGSKFGTADLLTTESWKGVLRTDAYPLATAATNYRLQVSSLQPNTPGGPWSGTVRVGRMGLRVV